MTQDISRDAVMARYFELDSEIEALQRQHKAALEPLAEEQKLCALFIKNTMNEANEQQIKITGVGQAYFTTKTSCKVTDFDQVIGTVLAAAPPPPGFAGDWGQVLAYIQSAALWSMLTKAVAKEQVKEYAEVHSAPPPGVELVSYRDLSWSRAK